MATRSRTTTAQVEQDRWIEVRSQSFRFVSQIEPDTTTERARRLGP